MVATYFLWAWTTPTGLAQVLTVASIVPLVMAVFRLHALVDRGIGRSRRNWCCVTAHCSCASPLSGPSSCSASTWAEPDSTAGGPVHRHAHRSPAGDSCAPPSPPWCAPAPQTNSPLCSAPPPADAVARGLGRSYGDAAQNADGTVVDCADLTPGFRVDAAAGTVTASAGTSLDTLLRHLLPRGFFLR